MTERRVHTHLDADGTATLTACGLPADRAAAAAERLTALAKTAKNAGDARSLDQLRADTLLDLLDGTVTGPHPAPRHGIVELTVPLTTLMRLTDEPGDLAGWGPVIADIARRVADDRADDPAGQRSGAHHRTQWRYRVTDGVGHRIHHGRLTRRPTTHTTATVISRNRTCRAPGCRTPARHCDLDHTHDWAKGGPTTEDNLAPLCRHDHRLKHHGHWRLRQLTPGVFAWTTALGHTTIVGPNPP